MGHISVLDLPGARLARRVRPGILGDLALGGPVLLCDPLVSALISMRHWPLPPILIAGSSPDRTNA